uniref:PI3K/PI4K domain-containing protein n=1 Tax=Heterorhabditis bacteriophora TaxID=37862 RepID=A0A1I7XT16_HETBA
MDTELLMGAKERNCIGTRSIIPSIMIPLTEMLEHALPRDHAIKVNSLSQFVMDTPSAQESHMGQLPEVFIQSIDNDYLILKSLQRPKRLVLRGVDGRRYQIMCKPSDELRKDARFMDVNRMMNGLMRQNADARRRQLMVRTFSVIPLQPSGGILEWVPNLVPYRTVLQPLFEQKSGGAITDNEWHLNWDVNASLEQRIERMRKFYYRHYPLVMAEWFRRQFPDPSSWHSARIGFARSAAVMSMIGFVLGLDKLLKSRTIVIFFYVVPFRLTRNMVNGFGPTGVEGSFRKACESTLRVMREHKDTLLTALFFIQVIQTFVHDPLLEWITTEARAQQNKGRGQQRLNAPTTVREQANENVSMILKRLDGHIVSPESTIYIVLGSIIHYVHAYILSPVSFQLNTSPGKALVNGGL